MKVRTASAFLGGVLLTIALLVAGAAQASAATVTGGNADWGVKSSFRSYVISGPAMGSITPSEGATTNPDGTFDWQPASGTYVPPSDYSPGDTNQVNATFGGKVFFTGHAGILKFTIRNPRVTYAGDTGVLYADVVSSAPFGPNAGQETSYPNVDFATLDLTGATKNDDGSKLTVSNIAAKLTANGATAFAGFYPAGTALDPISFEFTYAKDAPAGDSGKVTPAGKSVKVSKKGGEVKLASVSCESADCTVEAPKTITGTIKGGKSKGKKVKVKVDVPTGLKRGESGDVTATFKKGSAKKLAKGKSLKLSVDIKVKGDGNEVTQKVTVKAVPK